MRDETKSKLLFWVVVAIMVLLMVALCIAICEDVKAEKIEVFVKEEYCEQASSYSSDNCSGCYCSSFGV